MPRAARDCFVIAQFSDLHCGDARHDPELLDYVIDEVNALEPDLVVVPGDLTVAGYRDEYVAAAEKLARLTCPEVAIVPGNHDSRNVGYLHFIDLFGSRWDRRELRFADCDPEIGCELVRVVLVDSSKPDLNDGELGRHRYEWLAEQLDGEPAFTVVVLHHHLVGIPETGRERNVVLDAGDVLAILDRHKVDLVLAGHKHVPYVWRVNDMLIATSGTACTYRNRGQMPPSYNIITVTKDAIEITVVLLDGSGRHERKRFARKERSSANPTSR